MYASICMAAQTSHVYFINLGKNTITIEVHFGPLQKDWFSFITNNLQPPTCLSSPEEAPIRASLSGEHYPNNRWLPQMRHGWAEGSLCFAIVQGRPSK